MGEVTGASEVHRHTRFLGGGDDFFVTDGPAGLDHGLHTGIREQLEAVGEGEEGVGDAVQVVGKPGEDLTVLRVARALRALL